MAGPLTSGELFLLESLVTPTEWPHAVRALEPSRMLLIMLKEAPARATGQ